MSRTVALTKVQQEAGLRNHMRFVLAVWRHSTVKWQYVTIRDVEARPTLKHAEVERQPLVLQIVTWLLNLALLPATQPGAE